MVAMVGVSVTAMRTSWRSPLSRVGSLSRMKCLSALVALVLSLAGTVAVTPPAVAAADRAVVEIVTVPSLPGARFSFDGKTVAADRQGVVRIPLNKGSGPHKLAIIDTKIDQTDRDFTFVRWSYAGDDEQDFLKELTGLRVARNLRIKAAFRGTYLVEYSFSDQARVEVDRRRVTRVEFSGDNGHTVTGDGSGKLRVVGIRPVVKGGTVLAKEVHYRVQRVDVDGSNVVQVNQQVFVPSQDNVVVVPLLLRTAHFSTRDFLFGHPVGKSIRLTYPDNRQNVFPLDSNGKASVTKLARGNYTVSVNAPAIAFDRPVALSQNQYVVLPVLTYLDVAVLAGAGMLFIAVLIALRSRARRLRLEAARKRL